MGIGAGERTAITRVLVLVSLPLLAAMLWFMFHNPTIHGVPLNSADDGTSVGDWTCLAPYDITLFHASNEYSGNEVADSDYASQSHCYKEEHCGHGNKSSRRAQNSHGRWSRVLRGRSTNHRAR